MIIWLWYVPAPAPLCVQINILHSVTLTGATVHQCHHLAWHGGVRRICIDCKLSYDLNLLYSTNTVQYNSCNLPIMCKLSKTMVQHNLADCYDIAFQDIWEHGRNHYLLPSDFISVSITIQRKIYVITDYNDLQYLVPCHFNEMKTQLVPNRVHAVILVQLTLFVLINLKSPQLISTVDKVDINNDVPSKEFNMVLQLTVFSTMLHVPPFFFSSCCCFKYSSKVESLLMDFWGPLSTLGSGSRVLTIPLVPSFPPSPMSVWRWWKVQKQMQWSQGQKGQP